MCWCNYPQVIVQKLLGLPFEMGYNAMDDKIQDLLAAGVIDPAKVTKNGLLNSCSIAGIMLTTQVIGGERSWFCCMDVVWQRGCKCDVLDLCSWIMLWASLESITSNLGFSAFWFVSCFFSLDTTMNLCQQRDRW